jgi:hypothetical protein
LRIKVRDEDAAIALDSLYNGMKDDEDVKALGIPLIVTEAKAAVNDLERSLLDMKAWKVTDAYFEKRQNVDAQMKTFSEKLRILTEYHACLVGLKKDSKKEVTLSDRRSTYALNNIAKDFIDGGAPPPLAMEFATLARTRGEGDDVLMLPDNTIEFHDRTETFLTPVVFNAGSEAAFALELTRAYKEVHEVVSTKVEKYAKLLKEKGSGFACIGLPAAELDDGMLKMAAAPGLLKGAPVFPVVVVQKDLTYPWSRGSYPLQGSAALVQVFHGYAQVLLLDMAHLVAADKGLDNLDATIIANAKIKAADKSFNLGGCVQVGCPAGHTVFVPFGFVPLVVMSESVEGAKAPTHRLSAGYGSYVIWYLGVVPPVGIDEAVSVEAHGQMSKAAHLGAKSIKEYAPEVKQFLASWDPAKKS